MSVADRLVEIRAQIAKACLDAGRKPDDVTLVAVSKTKSIKLIGEAVTAGQQIFGENYVQEILPKISARPNIEWHFIGSLQTNKVKLIVGKVALIQSVDRAKLLGEIAKAAAALKIKQRILLELHVGDEESKAGASPDEIFAMIAQANEVSSSIEVCGLMALPPLFDDESSARAAFASVREVFEAARTKMSPAQQASFKILSMGTSADFAWAIHEGATHVRVGTSIFGSRS